MRTVRTLTFTAALLTACAAPDDAVTGEGVEDLTSATDDARVLYGTAPAPAQCVSGTNDARVRCLIGARYAPDPAARDLALDLFAATGGIAGVLPEEDYDGGYRGIIHFVPELPIDAYRKHLSWTNYGLRYIDWFMSAIRTYTTAPVRYRHREVHLRYFRSVGRTTPSAMATSNWELAYNVSGSLHTSPDAVRETLFHEIFHMNDIAQGGWSATLAPIVDGIVARCGTDKTCLAPYAPTSTAVRGGTYYAFQPGNGPYHIEYAAELASRYFEEQRVAMTGVHRDGTAFKCGPSENRRAWALLRDQFFGGVDLVPSCR